MTTTNPLIQLLAAPLRSDWTIEGLAEEVLSLLTEWNPTEPEELVIDSEVITDRQTLRLLRPLIACLAVKSATEAGASPNLYGGSIAFQRQGPDGPVWIHGQFKNTSEAAKLILDRTDLTNQEFHLISEQKIAASPTAG